MDERSLLDVSFDYSVMKDWEDEISKNYLKFSIFGTPMIEWKSQIVDELVR